MKIIITADLHYNVKRSRDPARQMIERVKHARPDVVALVGDTAGHDLSVLSECLSLFAD
jgi:predicted phosphodiesterase